MKTLLIFIFPFWLVLNASVNTQVERNVWIQSIETEDHKQVILLDVWDAYDFVGKENVVVKDTLDGDAIQWKETEL